MKIIPIKQKDDSSCGPTCIKMVADYFNVPVTLEEIERISNYQQEEGLTNKDLVTALGKLGFTVKEKPEADWDNLTKENISENVYYRFLDAQWIYWAF